LQRDGKHFSTIGNDLSTIHDACESSTTTEAFKNRIKKIIRSCESWFLFIDSKWL